MPARRFAYFAFVGLALLASRPVQASTETSLGEGGSGGATLFSGLSQSPEANLFTGALATSVDIEVPQGRKNLTPRLRLQYSSSAGAGPFGLGWELALGSIQRSTRWGVPRCDGPGSDAFVLSMPDGVVELLNDPPGSADYRPRFEDRYVRARFDASSNTWEVYDATGMKYEFGTGGVNVGNLVVPPGSQTGHCIYTSSWPLRGMVDPNDNRMTIGYEIEERVIYPTTIEYGGRGPVEPPDVPHFYRVVFDYEPRAYDDAGRTAKPNPSLSYLGGPRANLIRRVPRFAFCWMVRSCGATN